MADEQFYEDRLNYLKTYFESDLPRDNQPCFKLGKIYQPLPNFKKDKIVPKGTFLGNLDLYNVNWDLAFGTEKYVFYPSAESRKQVNWHSIITIRIPMPVTVADDSFKKYFLKTRCRKSHNALVTTFLAANHQGMQYPPEAKRLIAEAVNDLYGSAESSESLVTSDSSPTPGTRRKRSSSPHDKTRRQKKKKSGGGPTSKKKKI